MARVSKKDTVELYNGITEAALNRLLLVRDDPEASLSLRGRRPDGPVNLGLVDSGWCNLTTKGKAVLKYHDSL